MNYISLILAFFAAMFGKAIRDTIDFHWERSFLNKWFKKESKIWWWFKSDWKRKPDKAPWKWSIFAPIHDGWHCSDFLSYLLLGLSLFYCRNYIDIFLSGAVYYTTFEILYKYVYVDRHDK